MAQIRLNRLLGLVLAGTFATPAYADWNFSDGASPNAFVQTNNMTLELQCDRIRFAPAGYEDSQDIANKRGLSIRFMKNGATEVGAFQAGDANASIRIVDNYPVEILFNDSSDYGFVLDQIAANAVLNLSMIDQDVSYGIFDLRGSGTAIKSLKRACEGSSSANASPEAPEIPESDFVKTPIDAFILAKLNENKLTPAPPADRRSLIRRLSFAGIVSLPPIVGINYLLWLVVHAAFGWVLPEGVVTFLAVDLYTG